MSAVRFSAAAQSDLLDIAVFIARDNPHAAENWLAAIEERCRLLADQSFLVVLSKSGSPAPPGRSARPYGTRFTRVIPQEPRTQ